MSELTTVDSRDRQMNYIRLSELHPLELRDIRQHVVDDIAERISDTGYNPARPMRVVPDDNGYGVVDGNHRLAALRQLEDHLTPESVPCVVEPESVDVYAVSHASNQDEDTYAQEDLFDHLDFIADLRDEHTQAEIAERLGWSRKQVGDYSRLLSNVVPSVLDLARKHQEGRGTTNVPSGTFTEGWFRNSGLYDLNRDGVDEYAEPDEDEPKHAQLRVMEWFVYDKNCGNGRGGGQIAEKAQKVEERCEQLELLENKSNVDSDVERYQEIKNGIVKGAYTEDSLKSAIENMNAEARDTAAFGADALEGLKNLDANSVDCVITDPPYGVNFVSHEDSGTHEYGIDGDEYQDLIRATFEELRRVCADNAHLYIFFATKRFDEITTIAGEFFDVTMTPLIWRKNNGTPTREKGGYEKQYAQYYEPILFCRMPNGRSRSICPEGEQRKNVLEYDRPSGDDRWHDSQKPRPLLRDLITNSTGPSETVLDPFAGSGSTLLAAKVSGRHYKGFELSEEPEPKFKKQLREVKE
jgi:site-specific DNA-methyltransferase (adenine-specific)